MSKKNEDKIKMWPIIMVGVMLIGACSFSQWKAIGRSTVGGNAAASLSHPGHPSTQRTPPSQRDEKAIGSSQLKNDKKAAIATAETLLRNEKATRLSEAGRPVEERALAAESYVPRDVIIEDDGSEHIRMDRKLRGLPVIGGGVVVHSREGRLLSMTRTLDLQLPDPKALDRPLLPVLSQQQAVIAANQYFPPDLLLEPTATMVYFAKDNSAILAYEVELFGNAEDKMPVNDLIYVDATTAAYLGRDSKIHAVATRGTAYTLLRGKVEITTDSVIAQQSPELQAGYVLSDPGRGGSRTLDGRNATAYEKLINAAEEYMDLHQVPTIAGSLLGKPYFDADNVWGTNQVNLSQRIGSEVHYGLAETWDYFKKQHNRNGIANDGIGTRAVANIASAESEFTNAFWSDGVKTMFYLNGSAEEASNPVIAIDVAGHEMSHGVTGATAMLLSSQDSGGLGEATSDIFGTMVEFFDNNPRDPPDYLLGENVYASGKPFRYMFKPSLDTRRGPDGRQYSSYDCYPKDGFNETVDEHFSSGVGNHFFYLLSEGAVVPKSHRSSLIRADLVCNGNTALRGITNNLAAQIWYRALTLYMTEQATYPQAREATQHAAADLQARGFLNAKQADAVACAWEAVEVPLPKGSKFSSCLRL